MENQVNEVNVINTDKKKKKGFLKTLLKVILGILLLVIVVLSIITLVRSRSTIGDSLKAIDGVTSVKRVVQLMGTYDEKYMITFTEPIDWDDPSKGTFEQRVLVGYNRNSDVNVYDIGGYCLFDVMVGSDLYLRHDDREELSKMYDASQVMIEYRYFGKSVPEGLSNDSLEFWDELTVENASKDFNDIITKLSTVLTGKKIFTGASKGGYTTNTMAYYYPDLCDAYVAYVAPLCNDREDPRFFENINTTIGDEGFSKEEAKTKRDIMLDFQLALLENRDELETMYYDKAIKNNCRFRDYATKEILWDNTIAEFSAGFWQYGYDFDKLKKIIEMSDTNDKEHEKKLNAMLKIVYKIADPSSSSTNDWLFPYVVQSYRQMGNYGYDYSYIRKACIDKFGEDKLVITKDEEKGLMNRMLFTDEQLKAFTYDDTIYYELIDSEDTLKTNLVRIYGGCDTWYAVRIPETDNPCIHSYVVKSGCHTSRISDLPEEEYKECKGYLDSYLGK